MAGSGRRKTKRKKSRARKKQTGASYWVEALLAAVFIVLVAFIWSYVSLKRVDQGEIKVIASMGDEIERPDQIIEDDTADVAQKKLAAPTPLKQIKPQSIAKKPINKYSGAPSVAIIIDDLGIDTGIVERLLALDIPVAFSILPHQKYSRSIALNARKMGQVVMLHLPMEPRSESKDPGMGALFTSFENFLIIKRIEEDLTWTPGLEGVNNHMGSRFTESESKMRVVMKQIKKRGLFFIDSRTTADTVAYKTALSMGVPSARRSVFLDNDREVEKISSQIMKLARKALDSGSAIGIGHPYRETVEAMEKALPKFASMGVHIVPVTALLSGTEEGAEK